LRVTFIAIQPFLCGRNQQSILLRVGFESRWGRQSMDKIRLATPRVRLRFTRQRVTFRRPYEDRPFELVAKDCLPVSWARAEPPLPIGDLRFERSAKPVSDRLPGP
jgi:hypothetical protein